MEKLKGELQKALRDWEDMVVDEELNYAFEDAKEIIENIASKYGYTVELRDERDEEDYCNRFYVIIDKNGEVVLSIDLHAIMPLLWDLKAEVHKGDIT